jgi:hypothetical protein
MYGIFQEYVRISNFYGFQMVISKISPEISMEPMRFARIEAKKS